MEALGAQCCGALDARYGQVNVRYGQVDARYGQWTVAVVALLVPSA